MRALRIGNALDIALELVALFDVSDLRPQQIPLRRVRTRNPFTPDRIDLQFDNTFRQVQRNIQAVIPAAEPFVNNC